MWEANLASSHGVFSARRILNYVLATMVAAFLWIVFSAPLAHAATDASWNGALINYEGNAYTGPADATTVENLDLLENTTAYTYVEPAPSGTGTSTRNVSRNIHVIYFAPDVDVSTATGAKYKTYIYQGPSSFSNPTSPIDISIDAQNTSPTTGTSSSCDVKDGLGWIICPVTKTLATGMDWVFKTLAGFLAVRPAETGQDTVLFRAWSYMRSFANVAFVISFLIIIYSQLTNIGLNNYSIKKLLPRLIIAAVLVNLSYYICSVAIDISNILGYSLQDVFIQIRNSLVGSSGNSWDLMSFESLSGFVLSGGTVAAAGGIALFSTLSIYGLAGSLFLLLPALVAGLVAVLIALVVMAARQAVITLLVIIAPLAFVAYLLPNTEKWFEKWQKTFMTLLVLFPAFSIIFGGSQLAATAIIQNADSINIVILGMLVQVAPLFITPMLVKLSGSTVGRIAGMINNPNKGIIDRTRNWSKEHADDIKAKRLATPPGRVAGLKWAAQHNDHNRRKRESRRKLHESMADNRFMGSSDNAKLYESQHEVETTKKTTEGRLARDLDVKMQNNSSLMASEMKMRLTTDQAATAKSQIDKVHEELRAGKVDSIYNNTDIGKVLSDLSAGSALATRNLALSSYAAQIAKRAQQVSLAESLIRNDSGETIDGKSLRDYAGGIDRVNGAKSALAFAMAQKSEAEGKLVKEQEQLIKQFKLSGEKRQDLAMGRKVVQGEYKIGNQTYTYDFTPDDEFARIAARDMQLAGQGSFDDILEIVQNSGGSLRDGLADIASAIPANGIPDKAAWMGGVFIDKVVRGEIVDRASVHREIINSYLINGTLKASVLAKNDAVAIKVLADAISIASRTPELDAKLADLKNTIGIILDEKSDYYGATSNASRLAFKALDKIL